MATADDPHPLEIHPPCEVCKRPIYLSNEIGWARIKTRTKVRADPDDYIDAEIAVHTDCVSEIRLLAGLVGE